MNSFSLIERSMPRMAALGAPTYWNPRFFARMISLGALATTYSLSGCYSILEELEQRAILGLKRASGLSEHINTDLQNILDLSRHREPRCGGMPASDTTQLFSYGD